jgi:hypothetical protein
VFNGKPKATLSPSPQVAFGYKNSRMLLRRESGVVQLEFWNWITVSTATEPVVRCVVDSIWEMMDGTIAEHKSNRAGMF